MNDDADTVATSEMDELSDIYTGNKPTPAPTQKPREERAAEWMDKSNTRAIDGASGMFPTIAGVQMAPFSMARAHFLRKLNSPFISGVKFSEIEDPFMAVGEFLLMCSVSLSEGRQLIRDKDSLELRSLEIIERINALNITEVMEAIVDYTTSELDSKVEAESKSTSESESNEPGNS